MREKQQDAQFVASARAFYRNAVRMGELTAPDRCQSCKHRARLHGHHDDYAKPLDVLWLCVRCHQKRHRALGWGHNSDTSPGAVAAQVVALVAKGIAVAEAATKCGVSRNRAYAIIRRWAREFCANCHGSGLIIHDVGETPGTAMCRTCNGIGLAPVQKLCRRCDGGYIRDRMLNMRCLYCNGTGKEPKQ